MHLPEFGLSKFTASIAAGLWAGCCSAADMFRDNRYHEKHQFLNWLKPNTQHKQLTKLVTKLSHSWAYLLSHSNTIWAWAPSPLFLARTSNQAGMPVPVHNLPKPWSWVLAQAFWLLMMLRPGLGLGMVGFESWSDLGSGLEVNEIMELILGLDSQEVGILGEFYMHRFDESHRVNLDTPD